MRIGMNNVVQSTHLTIGLADHPTQSGRNPLLRNRVVHVSLVLVNKQRPFHSPGMYDSENKFAEHGQHT